MKIVFQLTNKNFEDALAVCINEETKELTEQDGKIDFEISDTEVMTVQVQYIIDNEKIKCFMHTPSNLLAFFVLPILFAVVGYFIWREPIMTRGE